MLHVKSQSLFKQGGFQEYLEEKSKEEKSKGRNPFLSRAGFKKEEQMRPEDLSLGRNPFLSRAGFKTEEEFEEETEEEEVAIPF